MKTTAVAGIVLAIIGAVSLAYQGITYTTREKKVDPGICRNSEGGPEDDSSAAYSGSNSSDRGDRLVGSQWQAT